MSRVRANHIRRRRRISVHQALMRGLTSESGQTQSTLIRKAPIAKTTTVFVLRINVKK